MSIQSLWAKQKFAVKPEARKIYVTYVQRQQYFTGLNRCH